jgi:nucleoside-diphosphate-sugar epimerase
LDIARANILAAQSEATGVFDVCTGEAHSMNEVAAYFDCPIDYVPDRPGDIKHLSEAQDPKPALEAFGYKYEIPFNYESMKVYL